VAPPAKGAHARSVGYRSEGQTKRIATTMELRLRSAVIPNVARTFIGGLSSDDVKALFVRQEAVDPDSWEVRAKRL